MVLTHRNAFVNVKTTLYGDVTPQRAAVEQAIIRHRVEQLSPLPKRVERVEEEYDAAYMVPDVLNYREYPTN